MVFPSTTTPKHEIHRSTFGDMRSTLQRKPNRDAWRALCAAMDQQDIELTPTTLFYLRRSLDAWPSTLKRMPYRWLHSLKSYTAPHRGMTLSTHLDLQLANASVWREGRESKMEALSRIAHHEHTQHIQHVHIGQHIDLLTSLQTLPNLRSLSANWHGIHASARLRDFLFSDVTNTLESLDLSHARMPWRWVLQNPALTNLTALYLNSGRAPAHEWAMLPDATHLRNIHTLSINHHTPPSLHAVRDLFGSPLADGLTHLSLHGFDFSGPTVHTIKAALTQHLPLHTLDISQSTLMSGQLNDVLDLVDPNTLRRLDVQMVRHLTDIDRLMQHDALRQLHTLDLTNAQLDHRTAEALSAAPELQNLRHLRLCLHDHTRTTGLKNIATSAFAETLETLNLGGPHAIEPSALEHLLTCPSLSTLGLEGNQIGAAGARAIAQSTGARTLRTLNLSQNQITTAGALALAKSPHLEKLTELNLSSPGYARNDIGDDGLIALCQAPCLAHIQHLNLSNNLITRRGLSALCDLNPPLHTLDLSFNPLDDLAMIELAQSPVLANIRHLFLDRCNLTYRGLLALLESPYLGQLLTFSIESNELSHQGQRLLLQHQERLLSVERFCYHDRDQWLHPQHYAEIEQTFHMCTSIDARMPHWRCRVINAPQALHP